MRFRRTPPARVKDQSGGGLKNSAFDQHAIHTEPVVSSPANQRPPTLGIYIQVPFCASKCSFCNFSSGVEPVAIFDRYTSSLQREVEAWSRFFPEAGIPTEILSPPVNSIYIGGGTPTLLEEERLGAIVGALREYLLCREEAEFTLETTPGSTPGSLLEGLRRMGVNRLSIGAQTFDDRELRSVGRLHSADDTGQLVRHARRAGFQNISLDLIAGLPYQTEESFRRSLEAAVNLRPEHLSLYLFEVDEKSRLGREVVHGGNRYHAGCGAGRRIHGGCVRIRVRFPHRRRLRAVRDFELRAAGVSESRHNRRYWQLAPYVGLGAGAHSFDGARRWSNHVDVQRYMASLEAGRSPIDEVRTLTVEEQVEEFFFLGLRQADGVDLDVAQGALGRGFLEPWEAKIRILSAKTGSSPKAPACALLPRLPGFQ